MFNTVSLDHEIVHGMKAPRTVISALVLFFCLCFIETKIYLVETESFDNKGEFKQVGAELCQAQSKFIMLDLIILILSTLIISIDQLDCDQFDFDQKAMFD